MNTARYIEPVCCQTGKQATPLDIENRPGLSKIDYRVGDYASFRQTMMDEIVKSPELRNWSAREIGDYGSALLEMWAYLADILTFYQERISNEVFLRTAVHRDSVMRLAAMLDYKLNPGVAATTHLAFSLEDDSRITIPKRLKVQSIPGPDEKPQKFETIEATEAFSNINEMHLDLTEPQPLVYGQTQIILKGTDTGLTPGDYILFLGEKKEEDPSSEHWDLRKLRDVRIDSETETTTVSWGKGIGHYRPKKDYFYPKREKVEIFAMRLVAWPFGVNAPDYRLLSSDLTGPSSQDKTIVAYQKELSKQYEPSKQYKHLSANPTTLSSESVKPIFPDWSDEKYRYLPEDPNNPNQIFLDDIYDTIQPGSWIALVTAVPPPDEPEKRGYREVYHVERVDSTVAINYTLTSKVTRLTVDGEKTGDDIVEPENIGKFPRQGTVILAQSEPLVAAEIPIKRPLTGTQLVLGQYYPELEADRKLLVKGELTNTIDWVASEVAEVGEVSHDLELNGRLSSDLSDFKGLTNNEAHIKITIGGEGPHEVEIVGLKGESNLVEVRKALRKGIRTAHSSRTFKRTGIIVVDDRLLILPGVMGDTITFEASSADPALSELGLERPVKIGGKISSDLSEFAGLTKDPASIRITIGGEGPHEVKITGLDDTTDLEKARKKLQAGIQKAHDRETFEKAAVVKVDDRLLVLPGVVGDVVSFEGSGADPALSELGLDRPTEAHQTVVTLKKALQNSYKRSTVRVFGNVAKATHGETIDNEMLGSGMASSEFQEFILKKSPTTFIPAIDAPRGALNTLDIRIGDVLWKEVESLYGRTGTDQVYVTRVDDDDSMTVQFGDGKTGSRLPTGHNNIVANYRQGLGSEGDVSADTLKSLLAKPVGLKSVTNPREAEGGTDRESLQDARINTPYTVRTFERAVSLQDYEDIARSYTGIAKAKAISARSDGSEVVQLTIAGEKGTKIDMTSETYKNFTSYLNLHRDTNQLLNVIPHDDSPIELKVVVQINETYAEKKVLSAARTAVLKYFDFDNLRLGQGIHLSNIYEVLQQVEGVTAAKIEYLDQKAEDRPSEPSLVKHLPVEACRIGTLKSEDLVIESDLTLPEG